MIITLMPPNHQITLKATSIAYIDAHCLRQLEFTVIELGGEAFSDLRVRFQHFRVEFGQFLGVLHDGWHLDRSRPVDVVKALAEGEFLQDAFLYL
jgi:hypothetical protein